MFECVLSEDEWANLRCKNCGVEFTVDACFEENLVFCINAKRLKPRCPSCGITEALLQIETPPMPEFPLTEPLEVTEHDGPVKITGKFEDRNEGLYYNDESTVWGNYKKRSKN